MGWGWGSSRVRVRGDIGETEVGVTCYHGWKRQPTGSSLELPEGRQNSFYVNSLETSDSRTVRK